MVAIHHWIIATSAVKSRFMSSQVSVYCAKLRSAMRSAAYVVQHLGQKINMAGASAATTNGKQTETTDAEPFVRADLREKPRSPVNSNVEPKGAE